MLKKFCLKNYKTFKNEIVIDFSNIAGYQFSTDCISNGLISVMQPAKLILDVQLLTYVGLYLAQYGLRERGYSLMLILMRKRQSLYMNLSLAKMMLYINIKGNRLRSLKMKN